MCGIADEEQIRTNWDIQLVRDTTTMLVEKEE